MVRIFLSPSEHEFFYFLTTPPFPRTRNPRSEYWLHVHNEPLGLFLGSLELNTQASLALAKALWPVARGHSRSVTLFMQACPLGEAKVCTDNAGCALHASSHCITWGCFSFLPRHSDQHPGEAALPEGRVRSPRALGPRGSTWQCCKGPGPGAEVP